MPRATKETTSDEENENKVVRTTRSMQAKLSSDAPAASTAVSRRSKRNKQTSNPNGSPTSPESDTNSSQSVRVTRSRVNTMDSGAQFRRLRSRDNSLSSEISEVTDISRLQSPSKRGVKRTAADLQSETSPVKSTPSYASRRLRAGSESISSPMRVTRRTKASSVEPELRTDTERIDSPMRSRKRKSVLPIEPTVLEEEVEQKTKSNTPVSNRTLNITSENDSENSTSPEISQSHDKSSTENTRNTRSKQVKAEINSEHPDGLSEVEATSDGEEMLEKTHSTMDTSLKKKPDKSKSFTELRSASSNLSSNILETDDSVIRNMSPILMKEGESHELFQNVLLSPTKNSEGENGNFMEDVSSQEDENNQSQKIDEENERNQTSLNTSTSSQSKFDDSIKKKKEKKNNTSLSLKKDKNNESCRMEENDSGNETSQIISIPSERNLDDSIKKDKKEKVNTSVVSKGDDQNDESFGNYNKSQDISVSSERNPDNSLKKKKDKKSDASMNESHENEKKFNNSIKKRKEKNDESPDSTENTSNISINQSIEMIDEDKENKTKVSLDTSTKKFDKFNFTQNQNLKMEKHGEKNQMLENIQISSQKVIDSENAKNSSRKRKSRDFDEDEIELNIESLFQDIPVEEWDHKVSADQNSLSRSISQETSKKRNSTDRSSKDLALSNKDVSAKAEKSKIETDIMAEQNQSKDEEKGDQQMDVVDEEFNIDVDSSEILQGESNENNRDETSKEEGMDISEDESVKLKDADSDESDHINTHDDHKKKSLISSSNEFPAKEKSITSEEKVDEIQNESSKKSCDKSKNIKKFEKSKAEDSDSSVELDDFFLKLKELNSNSSDEETVKNSIDSDIEREYNLKGKSITKHSDDDVPGDECRASEMEESDSEDEGSDLDGFIVDDDEVESDGTTEDTDDSEEEEDVPDLSEHQKCKETDSSIKSVIKNSKFQSSTPICAVNHKQKVSEPDSLTPKTKSYKDSSMKKEKQDSAVQNKSNNSTLQKESSKKVTNDENKEGSMKVSKKKRNKDSKNESVSLILEESVALRKNRSYDLENKNESIEVSTKKETKGLNGSMKTGVGKGEKSLSSQNQEMSPGLVKLIENVDTKFFNSLVMNHSTWIPNTDTPRTKYLKKDRLNRSDPSNAVFEKIEQHLMSPSSLSKIVDELSSEMNTIQTLQNNQTTHVHKNKKNKKRNDKIEIIQEHENDEKVETLKNKKDKKRKNKVEEGVQEHENDENVETPKNKKNKKRKNKVEEIVQEHENDENVEPIENSVENPTHQESKKKKKHKKIDEKSKMTGGSQISESDAYLLMKNDAESSSAPKRKKNKNEKKTLEAEVKEPTEVFEDYSRIIKKEKQQKKTEKIMKEEQKQLKNHIDEKSTKSYEDHSNVTKKNKSNKKNKNQVEEEQLQIYIDENPTKSYEDHSSVRKKDKKSKKNKIKEEQEKSQTSTNEVNDQIITEESSNRIKKNKRKKLSTTEEEIETENLDKKSKTKRKQRLPELEEKPKNSFKEQKHSNKENDGENNQAPESVSFAQAKKDGLECIKKIKNSILATKQRRTMKEERTGTKRLPEDVIQHLSDVNPAPSKKRKISNSSFPSRSSNNSAIHKKDLKQMNVQLSTSGSTTQFEVVSLEKIKKRQAKVKKALAVAIFREKMLSRNPRQPGSTYMMYLEKQKASGKDWKT